MVPNLNDKQNPNFKLFFENQYSKKVFKLFQVHDYCL